MNDNSSETLRLLRHLVDGDAAAWDALLARHRRRLHRMVSMRIDDRVCAKVNASDIIREACAEASLRLARYLKQPTLPFYLWLRSITTRRLTVEHRRQLGQQAPDRRAGLSLYRGALPETTTATLAAQLLGQHETPSQAAVRTEMKIRLQQAINHMHRLDREILAMRHFERLTAAETARLLDIERSEATRRYLRALKALKAVLSYQQQAFATSSNGLPVCQPVAIPDAERRTLQRLFPWCRKHPKRGVLIALGVLAMVAGVVLFLTLW